MLKGIE